MHLNICHLIDIRDLFQRAIISQREKRNRTCARKGALALIPLGVLGLRISRLALEIDFTAYREASSPLLARSLARLLTLASELIPANFRFYAAGSVVQADLD